MNVISTYKYAHISAFKAREVTRAIQGLPVSAALDLLAFTPRKAAALVSKTLKSAIANAENNNNLRPESLVVREAVVGEGPTAKRFQPKARGSAGPIRKRTAHIRIVVTDEIAIETRESRQVKSKKHIGTPEPKPATAKKSAKSDKGAHKAGEAVQQPEAVADHSKVEEKIEATAATSEPAATETPEKAGE